MPAQDSQTELEVLFPEGKIINISGSDITIKPFTFGQLPKVMKLMKKLGGLAIKNGNIDFATALDVFADGGDELSVLMAECINKEVLFVTNLQMDEGLALIAAFIEVNSDFFIRKVLPMLKHDLKRASLTIGLK